MHHLLSCTPHTFGSDVKHLARKLVLSEGENAAADDENAAKLKQIVEEHAVVMFSKKECCMAYATKTMLLRMGANPLLLEVDDLGHLRRELSKIGVVGDMIEGLPSPLVFVGGRLVGGPERVMTMHMSGELVPLLKEAGALWI